MPLVYHSSRHARGNCNTTCDRLAKIPPSSPRMPLNARLPFIRAAHEEAGTCSIAVAAKANGLNPRKYVQWLLEEMPNAKDPGGPAYLDSLMPWSESVPADIRLRPEAAEEAARMTDDPIIDIAPRPSATTKKNRSLSELSRPKRENLERLIVLHACFDADASSPTGSPNPGRGRATHGTTRSRNPSSRRPSAS